MAWFEPLAQIKLQKSGVVRAFGPNKSVPGTRAMFSGFARKMLEAF